MTDLDEGPDPLSQAMLRFVPKVGPVVAQYRVDRYEQHVRRTEKLAAAAAELLDIEDLFARIAGDERLSDMFEDAVAASIKTSSDQRIRLLGRALASGALAEDEAAVDAAYEVLRVATQLDAVDIRALLCLEPGGHMRSAIFRLSEIIGMDRVTASTVVARLQHLGLLDSETEGWISDPDDKDDHTVEVDAQWVVSRAGQRVLEMLDDLGDESESSKENSSSA